MVQRSVKRSAVRVRWEFSDTPYKNYDELPLFLNAATVAKVLGIAPSISGAKRFIALREFCSARA